MTTFPWGATSASKRRSKDIALGAIPAVDAWMTGDAVPGMRDHAAPLDAAAGVATVRALETVAGGGVGHHRRLLRRCERTARSGGRSLVAVRIHGAAPDLALGRSSFRAAWTQGSPTSSHSARSATRRRARGRDARRLEREHEAVAPPTRGHAHRHHPPPRRAPPAAACLGRPVTSCE